MTFAVVASLAFISMASGTRLSLHHRASQNWGGDHPFSNKGWEGSQFVCTEKRAPSQTYWQSMFTAEDNVLTGTNEWCLADLATIEAALVKGASFDFTEDWQKCVSEKTDYALNLCKLKGKKADTRLSYSTAVEIPKGCLIHKPYYKPIVRAKAVHHIFEPAISKGECDKMIKVKPAHRDRFAPRGRGKLIAGVEDQNGSPNESEEEPTEPTQ